MTQKNKQLNKIKFKKVLEKEGWIFEYQSILPDWPSRCYKKVGNKEIDIEFCIGDFCTGIYDENLSLLEPKKRCRNFLEALVHSKILEERYLALPANL